MANYLLLVTANGNIRLEDAVSFSFERERYRCYTVFNGVFKGECDPAAVREVRFYLNNDLLHRGTPDSLICETRGSAGLVRVRSFSFTMSLGQNELEPGIVSGANLLSLLRRSNAPTTDLSIESNTPAVNYVYINEHTTLWEAMCVYTAKAYNSQPFIKNQNTVWCTAGTSTFNYNSEQLVGTAQGVDIGGIISDAYTVDNYGEYTISRVDEFARQRHISKQRYYPLDMEWSYDPQAGLKYHMGVSHAGRQYKEFTYVGFKGEQLTDRALLGNPRIAILNGRICYIRVEGSPKGIFTTVRCYTDIYNS